MSISAGEIVKLLKSDKDALRELSAAIASEPELRLAVINAVLADVATKQDLQQLRQELKGEMAQLRQEMKEEIAQLRMELRGDITATKQDFQQLRRELREEILQLREEMTQVRQELKGEIAQLREEIGLLRQHVDSEISQLRRDMNTNFRWTVGLIIAVWGTTVIPLLMRLAGVI
jgi:tRNA U34 5-carboxymethylaminomethyl modifying GTPase MnmE/TrmE